ncbi:hypothetical protein ADK82_19085 [Streptomyces sp. NRRL S-4]|nr:hypothetical protein ADK82_19085 [Streptomyces sp. NRRL S-4]
MEELQRLRPGWSDVTSVPDEAQGRRAVQEREAAAGLVTSDDPILATGWSLAPGAMVALVAVTALPILWHLPEAAPNRQPGRVLHRP